MRKLLLFFTMLLTAVAVEAAMLPPGEDFSASLVPSDNGKTLTLTFTGGGPKEIEDWFADADNRASLNQQGVTKLVIVSEKDIDLDYLQGGTFQTGPDDNPQTVTLSELTVPYLDLSQAKVKDKTTTITNTNIKGVKTGERDVNVDDPSNFPDFVKARNGVVTASCATDGNLAGFMEAFSGENFSKLTVTGTLGSTDAGALNATNVFLNELTAMTAEISDINGADKMVYLRLPASKTSADDVVEMGQMKQGGKNSALKMVGAYDPDNDNFDGNGKWAEVAIHSFEANNVFDFMVSMGMRDQFNFPVAPRSIRLSGEYGDNDLVYRSENNSKPTFGDNCSAEWDFTGAHFADCTIPATDAAYYNYDDPFCDGALVANTTSSNAFYYFAQYKTQVVNIKLPDNNMTNLPYRCLNDLGAMNKDGYIALYGQDAFDANKAEANCVPLETLVIPNCYTDLEEECGKWARIRHLVVGSDVKRIHGGAFLKCDFLEDLDFASGINNCYIGDQAFNECRSMKHIALSEGIVSIGNGAFWNSQHLESIRLPQSLINIGNNAFNNCLALTSITIPENVEKIGQGAFILCPFTDIYLTTTDPAKIPLIWSAGISEPGNGFGSFDGRASFYHMHLDGWDGIPDTPQKAMLEQMTWDEAAEYYYTHVNGIPVFHFNKQLADAVRAQISATYAATSTDGYGLPLRSDMYKRSNVEGADLGTVGQGKYTRDGWAQFMLMKEFSTDPGDDVYQREFEDVWYTICYPFDLTDEQLAVAFNETFNIVDFSGVEVIDAEDSDDGKQTLVLHFNTVAKTYYRDNAGNEYEVIGREKDPTSGFNYNIYRNSDGVEYHHSQVSSFLSANKTKTFAPGSSISESNANKDQAIFIDGYLVTAGHPYMVHPAIGTSLGQPRKCNFVGIDWKPMTQWASIFEAQKRTVDLGVAKGTIGATPQQCVPDEDNYLQAAYSDYAGQTYTFKGNAVQYRDGAQAAIGNEPQVPEKPTAPVAPTEPTETLTEPTQTIPAPTPLTAEEQELVSKLTDGKNENERGPWYGITETITATYNDGSAQWNSYTQKLYIFVDMLSNHGYNIYGGDAEAAFNWCKETFNKSINYASDYAAYLANQAEWAAYNANQAAWAAYNNYDPAAAQAAYEQAMSEYTTAYNAHEQWLQDAVSWQTLIPTGAYFLGRRGTDFPKFYREIADDTRTDATGGFWTQFTAVIIPNDAAKAGIETELGEGQAASANPSVEMVFDEGFLGEEKTVDEIEQIVAEAEEKGQKVQYMQVVYNINGQIVREGTELAGLPKGVYIVNGKKYFVK